MFPSSTEHYCHGRHEGGLMMERARGPGGVPYYQPETHKVFGDGSEQAKEATHYQSAVFSFPPFPHSFFDSLPFPNFAVTVLFAKVKYYAIRGNLPDVRLICEMLYDAFSTQ